MIWGAGIEAIDKSEDAIIKLYGNVEKISWIPGPVKSYLRGVTGDTSKGYGNNFFEFKLGIYGAIGRGGFDFITENTKGVFGLAQAAPKAVSVIGQKVPKAVSTTGNEIKKQ